MCRKITPIYYCIFIYCAEVDEDDEEEEDEAEEGYEDLVDDTRLQREEGPSAREIESERRMRGYLREYVAKNNCFEELKLLGKAILQISVQMILGIF